MITGRGTETGLTLRLTSGTAITFIDDRPTLFAETCRSLFSVNDLAGYIGCRLEDGIEFGTLVDEIVERGLSTAEATAALHSLVVDWSRRGIAEAAFRPPGPTPVVAQTIAVGGLRLLVRYHDEQLAELHAPYFAHLASSPGACDIAYDLWTSVSFALLSRNGGPASVLQHEDVAPVLKARITEDAVNDPRWALALHAGCLQRNGRALLLSGQPGAGKTTLTCWLASAGFAYGADDVTLMTPDGLFQGLPLLPSVKAGAWPLVGAKYPGLGASRVHRRPDGKRVRFPMLPDRGAQGAAEIGWIVILRRRKGLEARLEGLSPQTALKAMLAGAWSRTGTVDLTTFGILFRAIASAQSYALHYSDLGAAVELLERRCAAAGA